MELRLLRRQHVLDVGGSQSAAREVAAWTNHVLPDRSLVLCMEMSGALKAYTGRPILRWDWLEPAEFEGLRETAERRGHRIYALLMPHEVDPARRRVSGRWLLVGARRGMTLWALPR
jgi:hypothetical protein